MTSDVAAVIADNRVYVHHQADLLRLRLGLPVPYSAQLALHRRMMLAARLAERVRPWPQYTVAATVH